jgi:glycosyltransferase involved in cell wall biosynthesis
MRVTYFVQTEGGCDWYRAILPLDTATRYGSLEAVRRTPLNVVMDANFNPEALDEDMKADVFVITRPMEVDILRRVKEMAAQHSPNAKIVIDYDDDMFNVSPLSRAYQYHGTKAVQLTMTDGTDHALWVDGKNINLKRNAENMAYIKQAMREADAVTVTTEILAERFRPFCKKVIVLPNCVDLGRWQKLPFVKSDRIKLYWGGGDSHWEDLRMLKGVLPEIVKKYPNVDVVMSGWMPHGFINDFPKGRVQFNPWESSYSHPLMSRIVNADIALIPLVENEFNRCKSPIKWIEAGAMSVPAVVSYVSPYKELEALTDKNHAVFVENTPDAWIDGISLLIENEAIRREIGENAHEVVRKNFDINQQHKRWADAYAELLVPELLEVS